VTFAEPRFSLSEWRLDDRTAIASVRGEIHVSTAPELNDALTEALVSGPTNLVVDLTAVEFIDSTGLSVLLSALRQVTRAGGRMPVVCRNPTVLRLFEITQLDRTFDLHADLDAALTALQPDAGASNSGAP